MADMPTTYETKTTSSTSGTTIGLHPEYLRTIPGILKIVEIILSIITFICACVDRWGTGQSWTVFVAMSAFTSTIVNVILHLLNLISRIPGPWLLIEFIYYCVFTFFFLIAAIVCAVRANISGAIGAAAFFAFAATAFYAVDTFFQFRAWRTGQAETTQTATTTTSSTVEQGPTAY